MLNNFIYADTKALFLNELNAGNVLDEAIVFIEDTKEIWNHGHYFAGDCGFDQNLFSEVQTAVAALQADKVNRNELSDYAKKTDLPNLSGYLTKDTADKTYSTIAQLNALNDKAAEALDAANTAQTNITTHAADTNNPHDVTKTQIGLGNVENTTLSTWTGSNKLTTCAKGTIIGSNNIGDQSVKYAETAGSANSSAEAATAGTAGYANSAGSVTNSLTVGTKTFNGSEAVTITASDLGLSSALKYCGTTSTAIKNGDTTKTITIDNKNHTAEPGCTVEYGDKLFTFTASNKWEELGNPGGYKPLQTAVSDPTASGNSTTFIDTISQDTNGKITVTKKNVKFPAAYSLPTASSTTLGGVKIGTDLSINENGVLSAEAHTLHSTPAPADMNSVTTNVTGYVNSPANGPQSASGSSDISGDTNVGSYFVFGNGSNCVSQFFAGYKNDTVEKPGGLYFRKWAVNQGWDGWKEILMVSPDGKLHKGRKNLNLSGINNLTIDGVLTANAATTTVAGLMSATDKQKLDGIASGANAYTHPSSSAAGTKGATADVTGTDGATIKVPKITVDSLGHVTGLSEYTYTSKNTTYSNATQSAAGLMTAADKKKVDELGTRAFDSTEYLPLSGGTIAGNGAALLAINRKNGNPVIEFHHNGSLMGRYGFATDGTPIGVVAGSQVTLIHSGNIGSYKAGDSTLLGGKAVNEFAYVGTYPEQGNYNYSMQSGIYRSNGKEEGLPNINSGCSVIHTNFDSNAANQLFLDRTKDFFAYRRKTGGAWSAWKTIAFTDSDITGNAATATKLKTARTIWGQSFNGEANVSGSMTGVSDITMSGAVKMGDATIAYDSNEKCIKFSF